jgi:hypothetical protein
MNQLIAIFSLDHILVNQILTWKLPQMQQSMVFMQLVNVTKSVERRGRRQRVQIVDRNGEFQVKSRAENYL